VLNVYENMYTNYLRDRMPQCVLSQEGCPRHVVVTAIKKKVYPNWDSQVLICQGFEGFPALFMANMYYIDPY